MTDHIQAAYQLGLWFNRTLISYYRSTYKGLFGAVQVQALDDLYVLGSVRPQEMADRLDIPKQHASKILSRLCDLSLAESQPDSSDGRSRIFCLTDSGRALVQEHIRQSNENFRKMLETLDGEALGELGTSLEKTLRILTRIKDPSAESGSYKD